MQDNKINKSCDRAIIEFSNGDRNALSVLYDCMARMIFSVAYAITGNYCDAEDVLQNTMIEITRYANTYRSGSNAKAWILTMARHLSIDTVRKRKFTAFIDDKEIAELPDSGTEFSQLEVIDMLSILDEDERQLVMYRLYVKLPYREISSIMDISIAASQKRFQRAIKKLKSYYS
ncbi:MAG: RNA polymerase sigma factor [Eubacteriales bacterium]|nr:RNA polymerase sigma factor [Eubacteriales bacterium]